MLVVLVCVSSACASMNYTEKCREVMNDCMRDCVQDASAPPGGIPMCTSCKPEAERCDAQDRLAQSQAK